MTDNEFTTIQHKVLSSNITLAEFLFIKLDMEWDDLFYDLYDRIEERKEHLEDL